MSTVATAHVELGYDLMTNSMRIRVLDGVEGVPTEEVIERLGSSCRSSRIRRKIGDITPLHDGGGVCCRVHLRTPLEGRDELHMRDALLEGGFLCV